MLTDEPYPQRMWTLYPETRPFQEPNSVLYRRMKEEHMPRTKKTTTTEAPKEKATRTKSDLTLAALAVGRTATKLQKLDERISREEAALAAIKDERDACAKEGDAALERLNATRK